MNQKVTTAFLMGQIFTRRYLTIRRPRRGKIISPSLNCKKKRKGSKFGIDVHIYAHIHTRVSFLHIYIYIYTVCMFIFIYRYIKL